MNKKFNIVYKTICNTTSKFYIGVHVTNNLEDGYLGSGIKLRLSVEKYGKENHTREVLAHFDTRSEAYELEAKLVNEEMLTNKLCMNLNIGGNGGSYYRSDETKAKIRKALTGRVGHKHTEEHKEYMRKLQTGFKHSNETKARMSASRKGKVPHNKGKKGLQVAHNKGKITINNGLVHKYIDKSEEILEGWTRGNIKKG